MKSKKHVDRSEYEKRLARITEMLGGIAKHADVQSLTRCPYRNVKDQCTAKFGCRNQRKPPVKGDPLICTHDGKLDYRTAWESDPEGFAKLQKTLKVSKQKNTMPCERESSATVRCGDAQCPATTEKTLFDHADMLGVRVPTSCGRMGHCHECIVEIRGGEASLSAPTEPEGFLDDRYRLACQAVVEHTGADIEFSLLRRSPQILTARSCGDGELDPAVTRHGDHVYYGDEQIDQYRGHIYGLAIDVGTTTVVTDMVDLETGESRFVTMFENPQRFGGSDILHRVSYDAGPFHGELHQAIINTLNAEIRDMCKRLNVSRHEIYEILIVGNAAMRDLFFGLDVQPIGQKPYKSTIEHEFRAGKRSTTTLTESARKYRLYTNRNAKLTGGPLIASHVGADAAANLVAMDMASQSDVVMVVDVGTNTEVIIGHKDRLIAASCPAGPAFEGGLITFGMTGCDGAIESVKYADGKFECKTIGGVEAQGFCGSGLIDLLAELRRADLMTPMGVFAEKASQFTILPERGITFSREDASHLAQAKAANYCGQMILMRTFGITPDRISKLYLAGGFANYVDPAAAIEIGFMAPVPIDRVVKIGNAALQGAREMLLSRRKRRAIEQLIATIEHVELETSPDFFEMFVDGCRFEPM